MNIINLLIGTNKWIKLFSGSLLCFVVIILINYLNIEEANIAKKFIIILAVPGAFALIGLVEIIFGVPFNQISEKWDALAGWQRGILGTIIVILTFVLMMFGIVFFA